MTAARFCWHLPTRLIFGPGEAARLGSLLPPEWERLLLVTDGPVWAALGAALRRALRGRAVGLFREVEPNPSLETVALAARAARRFRARAIVGVGGGSPLDAAKGAALLARNPGTLAEYLAGRPFERQPLPVVCLPTTSGTGSEATPYAVFTDHAAGTKAALSDPALYPALSIVDPELMRSMPAQLVVDSGLDALGHAVEAFLSRAASAPSDLAALEAVRLALAHLPAAAGRDRDAMAAMAWAATLAGCAIAQAGTILAHIMGYPLTLRHGVAHGRAGALLLPGLLRLLRGSSEARERVGTLDALFPAGGIEAFLGSLGVSCRLSDYGVRASEIASFAAQVMVKGDVALTPARIGRATVVRLYRDSM